MWQKIDGFERYSVSDSGDVRNDETGRILKPVKNACGYYKVSLNGVQVDVQILVAKAFPEICGEWYEGCQVNHLSEDKSDNSARNLSIVSPSENCKWGTRSIRKTDSGSGVKRYIYQFTEDGELAGIWSTQSLASKVLDINQTNISRCLHNVYNTAGGYKWSYVSPLNNNQNAA